MKWRPASRLNSNKPEDAQAHRNPASAVHCMARVPSWRSTPRSLSGKHLCPLQGVAKRGKEMRRGASSWWTVPLGERLHRPLSLVPEGASVPYPAQADFIQCATACTWVITDIRGIITEMLTEPPPPAALAAGTATAAAPAAVVAAAAPAAAVVAAAAPATAVVAAAAPPGTHKGLETTVHTNNGPTVQQRGLQRNTEALSAT